MQSQEKKFELLHDEFNNADGMLSLLENTCQQLEKKLCTFEQKV